MSIALGEVIRLAEPGFASGEDLECGTVQLRMNNVTTDGALDWSSLRRISADERKHGRYALEPNDLVFNSTNSPELVGKATLFRGFKEPVLFSNHFLRLRVDDTRADAAFIARWLNFKWAQRVFEGLCTRWVNQASVRKEDLLELSLELPPLAAQQRIASTLERADRLRRMRRYALELSDSFLPAAFLEMFGDPVSNPKALSIIELGEYLTFVTSGSRGWAEHYSARGARFIRSLDVRMNYISDEAAVYVTVPPGAEAERTRVRDSDVLLTITGSQIGRVAPVDARHAGSYVSQHVAILRLKPGLSPRFLSMFLAVASGGQREIARVQYGQTKPGLNLEQIRQFRVPVPSCSGQERFVAVLDRYEHHRKVLEESVRQSEHLFQSLVHLAFADGLSVLA